ncbi:MAG: hypothetical protein R3B68_15750 [Phycisphaerales bacterium]
MRRALATTLRHAFLPAAILATLLVAMSVASLWGVAYRRFETRPAAGAAPDPDDPTGVQHERTDLTIVLDPGELWISNAGTYYAPGFQIVREADSPASLRALRWWPFESRFLDDYGHGLWTFRTPMWLVVAPVFALASIAQWPWRAHRRRKRRRAKGRCERCAYDRAGLDSADAPCPECGLTPTPRSNRSTGATATPDAGHRA